VTHQPEAVASIRVGLIAPALAALDAYSQRNGISRVDAVNRALQVLDWLDIETKAGNTLLRRTPDGTTHQIHSLDGHL
jgi:hypothetical protein